MAWLPNPRRKRSSPPFVFRRQPPSLSPACIASRLSPTSCRFMDGTGDPAGVVGFGAVLSDRRDFDQIVHGDGLVSIAGFGSLLSGAILNLWLPLRKDFLPPAEANVKMFVVQMLNVQTERSARYTFPDLQGFRLALIHGFRRVFGHAAPLFFERGIANAKTKEISSVSAEPSTGDWMVATVFEINVSEVPAFIEREHEFRFLAVTPESLDGVPFLHPVVVCCQSTDEEYRQLRCKGSEEEFYRHYGRYNIEKIWRNDILPCRIYLRHCVLAAKNLGVEVYNNFLDHSFLGDRRTTIRQYLASNLELMNEEPPPSLRERYGG